MLHVWSLTIWLCLPLPHGECTVMQWRGIESEKACRVELINTANRLPDDARLYGLCSRIKAIDIGEST